MERPGWGGGWGQPGGGQGGGGGAGSFPLAGFQPVIDSQSSSSSSPFHPHPIQPLSNISSSSPFGNASTTSPISSPFFQGPSNLNPTSPSPSPFSSPFPGPTSTSPFASSSGSPFPSHNQFPFPSTPTSATSFFPSTPGEAHLDEGNEGNGQDGEGAKGDWRKESFKKALDPQEGTGKRREHSTKLRKARGQAEIAKRRKLFRIVDDSEAPAEDEGTNEENEQEGEKGEISRQGYSAEDIAELIARLRKKSAKVKGAQPAETRRARYKTRRQALVRLRRILTSDEDPPVELVVAAGGIQALVDILAGAFGTDSSKRGYGELRIEATWCLVNILACGGHEETTQALQAAPFLIAFLTSMNAALQDQAAWALANMAADSIESRDLLRSNGAVAPLASLLRARNPALVQTAAFALCNLTRGPNPRIGELFQAGVAEPLVPLLRHPETFVVEEVIWLLTYLTAPGDPFLKFFVERDLITNLEPLFARTEDIKMALGLLRVCGNIVVRSDAYTNMLLALQPFLPFLTNCLRSDQRVLRKEGTWVASNIAGGTPEQLRLLSSSGIFNLLIQLFVDSDFDIRREAAYALMNLSSEREYLRALVNSGKVLDGFLSLLRSPDPDIANLALTWVGSVLRHHPEGPMLVERAGGIDALEGLQFHENQTLYAKANTLIDEFYGEGYGEETGEPEEPVTPEEYPSWRRGGM